MNTRTVDNFADKCKFEHACIYCSDFESCKITSVVNNKVFFVDSKCHNCGYKLYYGNEAVCLCPVRSELYIKYNT